MGAKVKIEGKTAIIKGTTKVDNIEYILRGYERFEEKLKSLGAEIYKI